MVNKGELFLKIRFIQIVFVLLAGLSATVFAKSKFCDPNVGWGPTSELRVTSIDAFENEKTWKAGKLNNECKVSLSNVESPHGKALRIDYEIPSDKGGWVWLKRPTKMDITKAGRISFWIRGKGNPNVFELKFADVDGGAFRRVFRDCASNPKWHKETIDMKEIIHFYGGTNATPEPPFDLELAIAASYQTRRGGKGWVEIAGLEQIGINPHIQILMNQIGFDSETNKKAVVQLNNAENINNELEYKILSMPEREAAKSGKVKKFENSEIWPGQYWVVSFDELIKPGEYVLEVSLPYEGKELKTESYPFEIKPNILGESLSKSQFHYINFTRYPKKVKHSNPVPGGYIDTELDIERWMTTTPTWMWAMAYWQNLLSDELDVKGYDPVGEIKYAARFCIDMQKPDGHVYYSVKAKQKDPWKEDITAEQDTADCYLMDIYAPEAEGAYVVAMVEVAKALEEKDPALAEESFEAAVKAWGYLSRQNLTGIQYLGMYLWASTQLYDLTKEEKYLDTAKQTAEKLLPYQFLNYNSNPDKIFGIFYWNIDKSDFTYQYKFVHSIGLYLGLMELAEALLDNDELKSKIITSMDYFAYGFLKQTAKLNPFGKVAQALEPPVGESTDMQLYYFASPRCPMTDHGFNCDIMSYGFVALRYARLTGNVEFAKLAVNQINWVLGLNPSGFCMVSGIGESNPHILLTDINKGPVLGGLPNGFVSPKDGNKPMWLTEWCSEEYWKPHNAMMLALITELESNQLPDPFMGKETDKPRLSLQELKEKIDKLKN